MELIDGIKTRKSFRAFKPAPIPDDVMKQVLGAAGKSPSYTNTQPWEVAVVSGKKKDELSLILLGLAESDVPARPDVPARFGFGGRGGFRGMGGPRGMRSFGWPCAPTE